MVLHAVRGCLALDQAGRRALLRAYVWLTVIDVVLRIDRRHVFIRRSLAPSVLSLERGQQPGVLGQAETYAYWIEVAARHHVVRARCLHRALLLNYWLRRAGTSSNLRIGVRKQGPVLQVHAWVELNGQVVSESPTAIAGFTQLGAYPTSDHLEHYIQDGESRRTADGKVLIYGGGGT